MDMMEKVRSDKNFSMYKKKALHKFHLQIENGEKNADNRVSLKLSTQFIVRTSVIKIFSSAHWT